ncbi:MAG: hypothetical protein KAH31_09065 [Candidatus Sabulitectum sp.]|nr:hypothetical protein [Candidatus Sabulitectum sp.]
MKYIFLIIGISSLVSANNNEHVNNCSTVDPYLSADDITLTSINNWTLPYWVMGLEVYDVPGYFVVLGADPELNMVIAYDGFTGVPTGEVIELDPVNGSCFGIAWDNDPDSPVFYTTDWSSPYLFETDDFGTSWSSSSNPAGLNSRGMDFDDVNFWMISIDGPELYRIQPGSSFETLDIPEVPALPSGITVFPHEGNVGIAITTYHTHNIYFYQWDGSLLSFMGSAACPASSISLSTGLAFREATGNMYWSYEDSAGTYHLVEMSFEITSLQRSSWGNIKSSF